MFLEDNIEMYHFASSSDIEVRGYTLEGILSLGVMRPRAKFVASPRRRRRGGPQIEKGIQKYELPPKEKPLLSKKYLFHKKTFSM